MSLHEVQRCERVDLEQDTSPLQRHRRDRSIHRGSRVVDEHVHRAAQPCYGLRNDPLTVALVGQVGHDHRGAGTERFDPRRGLVERTRESLVPHPGASDDRDAGALGGEPHRGGGADAAARAGDERATTGKPSRHGRNDSAVAQM
jgi:hypothetical protein